MAIQKDFMYEVKVTNTRFNDGNVRPYLEAAGLPHPLERYTEHLMPGKVVLRVQSSDPDALEIGDGWPPKHVKADQEKKDSKPKKK